MPPVAAASSFAVSANPRLPCLSLDDLGVVAGIMTAGQAETLHTAVADLQNILVAGDTSTGKTTLTNALLAEVAKTADRVVLIGKMAERAAMQGA